MQFADLKNDFVFRRIFANRPDLLCALLNDLLERKNDDTIEDIEYLPSEQVPLVDGAKLSILDVRCKDRTGTMFIVEVQLLHHPGFLNRVVYNACKAYVSPLKAGGKYADLMNVIAISICDFDLWPDAKQQSRALPLVPLVSRWNMVERHSKVDGLLQVQYAFLELPKVSKKRPDKPGPDLWAWLFVHAPDLEELPGDDVRGPYREALELANEATFSQAEMDVYRRVIDEIQQVIEIAESRYEKGLLDGKKEGLREGKEEGLREGELKARRETLLRLLGRARLEPTEVERAQIDACKDLATLDRWIDQVFGAKAIAEILT
jgi:PD-(D/E)XK nuclease family transposase